MISSKKMRKVLRLTLETYTNSERKMMKILLVLLLFVSDNLSTINGWDKCQCPPGYLTPREVEELTNNFVDTAKLSTVKKGEKTFDLYRFSDTDMPLKSVFDILQNWYHHIEKKAKDHGLDDSKVPGGEVDSEMTNFIQKPRFFELNIGGARFTFGIRLKRDTQEIMIQDANGNERRYETLFKSFQGHEQGIKIIARELLEAANSPLNKQPDWNKNIKESKVIDDMRMFSLISQIAEGARPSDAYFQALREIAKEEIAAKVERVQMVSEFLQEKGYKPIIELTMNGKELLRHIHEFFETVEEYVMKWNDAKKKAREVNRNISPDEKGEFFLKLKRVKSDRELKSLFKQYNLKVTGEKQGEIWKNIRKAFNDFKGPPDNDKLKKIVEDNLSIRKWKERSQAQLDLEKELTEKILPEHDDHFLKNLKGAENLDRFLKDYYFEKPDESGVQRLNEAIEQLKLPYASDATNSARKEAVEKALPPLSAAFFETFFEKVKETNDAINQQIKQIFSRQKGDKVSGRIPGAGAWVRQLLEEVVKEKIQSFHKLAQITMFMEEDGLKQSRKKLIQHLYNLYIPLADYGDPNFAARSAMNDRSKNVDFDGNPSSQQNPERVPPRSTNDREQKPEQREPESMPDPAEEKPFFSGKFNVFDVIFAIMQIVYTTIRVILLGKWNQGPVV